MYKHSQTEIPYEDIDVEIREVIRYINKFDGIETIESCFGHNEKPCQIWLKAESIEALNNLIYKVFDNDYLWKISINTADFHGDYKDIRLLLSSGEIKDYPTVNLMVDNLTYRLKDICKTAYVFDEFRQAVDDKFNQLYREDDETE